MDNKEIKFLITSFLTWRVLLFIFLFVAISVVPLQEAFTGGDLKSYLEAPFLWAWVNFDGEHYLSIAFQGYQPLTYFYFPLYPLLVGFLARLLFGAYSGYLFSGLFVSHAALLIALFGFWKLIGFDYKKDIKRLSILLLLTFPTSFYLGSFYTESLFLALAIWSFYFARSKKWILAGLLGAFAGATRLVGIAIFPALLAELYLQRKERKEKTLFFPLLGVFLSGLGLLVYMHYLKGVTGDPLEFLHSVSIFGSQRSSELILLPQVFYRYFFKVLPNVNYNFFPVVFTTILELTTAILFSALSLVAFFRLRLSYAVYLAVGFLIPTLSGSFSSLPRYVLVLFPAFMVVATYLSKKPKVLQSVVFGVLLFLLAIATSLFVRGYWVS